MNVIHTSAAEDMADRRFDPVAGRPTDQSDSEQQLPRMSDEKDEKTHSDDEGLEQTETRRNGSFTSIQQGSSYKTLGRWQTTIIFITNQVGIGILSLPSVMQTLGLIPGIIAIIALGILATYTAYVLGQFFRRYPTVQNIVDCCQVVGGKPLAVVCAIAFVVNLCLTCSAACLTMSIALNTISEHALCTVAFIAIPAIASWLLCLPRKMKFVAHMGFPCTISIVSAVLIVMISLGIDDTPANAPPGWEKEILLVGQPSFVEGMNAVLNVAFAYAGNQAFVTVMAEMEDVGRDYTWSLIVLQIFGIPMYVVVGAVIYALAGQYVTSPALGSAPMIPAKVAYGVLFPCLLGTSLVFGHTSIKYMYVLVLRIMKRDDEYDKNTKRSWLVWISLGTSFWILAFILANSIPIFDSILSISSALFLAWFTFGISSVFWLYLNWNQQFLNWKKTCITIGNWSLILATLFLNGAGMYSSVQGMLNVFNDPEQVVNGPFTCADNSLF